MPEPTRVGAFLMKTAGTFKSLGEALPSRFQPLLRSEPIARKVEPFWSFADVAFVRMDGEFECLKDGVHPFDRRLERVAGAGEDDSDHSQCRSGRRQYQMP